METSELLGVAVFCLTKNACYSVCKDNTLLPNNKRFQRNIIREVAETHKPLFGGEHFLTGKEVCERLYISPRTLQDYRDKGIIPYTQFAGKILYKASNLERLLEENYSA